MIASEDPGSQSMRRNRIWEETKENFGQDIEEIQTNFQSFGLKSRRSTKIYVDKVPVGSKHLYECEKNDCEYAVRIIMKNSPNFKPLVEVSGETNY